MRISVKVKPNSKKEFVEKISDTELLVRVRARAAEGMANEAVIAALSDYFGKPKSLIIISRGKAAKNKIIDIL